MIQENQFIQGKAFQPLVSVIMNCFNGEKYLHEAIDSVLAQTYQNWEIIFWDNQSTDRSAEIFKSYTDPRLHYFYAPTHALLYESRNYAIEKAKGDFFAFLDVDDWWVPTKLEKQIPLFDDPEVGFVCSNYWIFNEKKRKSKIFRRKEIPSGWVLNELLMDYPVGMLTLVVRRTAFYSLSKGCDPRFHIIGDMDLVVRLALKWKMAACQEILAYYRLHDNNEGKKQKAKQVMEYTIWVDDLKKIESILISRGYKKVVNELVYMRGRFYVAIGEIGKAEYELKHLPIGRYKIKLWIDLVAFKLNLRKIFL